MAGNWFDTLSFLGIGCLRCSTTLLYVAADVERSAGGENRVRLRLRPTLDTHWRHKA